jgi:hypothetical protein
MDKELIEFLKFIDKNDGIIDWTNSNYEKYGEGIYKAIKLGYVVSYCETETYMLTVTGENFLNSFKKRIKTNDY